ncbi:MAG: ABC transporter substrate-binding protein [Firmicutes bacterium]|nr:ABC transporter substrate-binding protein [Bacillota bacterium]
MKDYGSRLVICIIMISLILSGCGQTGTQQASKTPEDVSGFYITDSFGREAFVPDEVENIACLYSFAGYAVSLLGRGDNLVAVPDGLKRDVMLTEIIPQVMEAAVPRKSGKINIEELLRQKPDVVIIRGDTARDEKEVEQLEKTGLNYIVVEYTNIEEQQKAISIIGEAIGRKEQALAFNDYYNDVIQRVSEVVDGIPEDGRARMYHSENQALRTTHSSTLPADWSRAAGVVSVSVGEELNLVNNDYYASLEQVLLWNPEVIIANENSAMKYILGNPQWSGIEAVHKGRVYQLPQGISRWGHPGSVETPLAILWTAKTVYPELFGHIDMESEVEYFYKEFFGYQLSPEMIEQVLSGEGLRKPKGEV